MKIRPILISVFLLLAIMLRADYSEMMMYQVIDASELAIVGTIVDVADTTFVVKIEKRLKDEGSYEGKTIRISKFKDWPCAQRWSAYDCGQKGLFFLKKYNGEYTVLGGGNEGEMPIIDNAVYFINYKSQQNHEAINRRSAYRFEYKAVLKDIQRYLRKRDRLFEMNFDELTTSLEKENDFMRTILAEIIVRNSSALGVDAETRQRIGMVYLLKLKIE